MSLNEIRHFLISFDPSTRKTDVKDLGTDYDVALKTYSEAEHALGFDSQVDTVLISADSLETIEQTHSSYFKHGPVDLTELLPS